MPAGCPAQGCPVQKSISGRFKQAELKCGEAGHVEADGVNISEAASTSFAIKRVRGGTSIKSVSGPMNGQHVRDLAWEPQRHAGHQVGDEYTFDVSADGVSAPSSNKFKFKDFPDYGPETKTFACSSGIYGWTGKFDIKYSADKITVTVKIKLQNRLGGKPATEAAAKPAIGPAVSDEDKTTMKADIEGKLSEIASLYRKNCVFAEGCSCPKLIYIVVEFVESGEHHVVDLYTGAGRANSGSWCRIKTRDNTYAHEVGHLLAFYDEYTGGAVGSAPRWKPNEPANIMNVGLTFPAEYSWDFRDWFAAKTGEEWTAKA